MVWLMIWVTGYFLVSDIIGLVIVILSEVMR